MANPLQKLGELGQSVWYDNISRSVLQSGALARLVQAGEVRGVTSNPTIFEKAIGGSSDYDADIQRLQAQGLDTKGIYEQLAIADIQAGADLLRPVHEHTGGKDGFISLEVSPDLAHHAKETVEEARRLHASVDRPNLMIKVPATKAGWSAIEELIGSGINVNVTVMFSMSHYDHVAEAYLRGLERALASGADLSRIHSVASVFISRVDTLIDERLPSKGSAVVTSLRGKAAVANTKLIYQRFREVFSGPRWSKLAAHGANTQRPLWASTATKDPQYSDILYVQEIIAADTVNTMKPETIDAFRDHGKAEITIHRGIDEARRLASDLEAIGIDLEEVGTVLQDQGVDLFADSFRKLLAEVEHKARALHSASATR